MLVFPLEQFLSDLERVVLEDVVYRITFDQKLHIEHACKFIAYILASNCKGIQVVVVGKVHPVDRFGIAEEAVFAQEQLRRLLLQPEQLLQRPRVDESQVSALALYAEVRLDPFSLGVFDVREVVLRPIDYDMRQEVNGVLEGELVAVCHIDAKMAARAGLHNIDLKCAVGGAQQRVVQGLHLDKCLLLDLIGSYH